MNRLLGNNFDLHQIPARPYLVPTRDWGVVVDTAGILKPN